MASSSSQLDENIRRFHEVNSQRKALEKEEEQLKKFFKNEAANEDVTFESSDGKIDVYVTRAVRRLFKQESARSFLSAELFEKCFEEVESTSVKVVKRKD